MSHGSCCKCPTDNEPRCPRRGPICRRRVSPRPRAERNSFHRPSSNWPGTASVSRRAAGNAHARNAPLRSTSDAAPSLVPTPGPRPPTLRPLLLGHGAQGAWPPPGPDSGGELMTTPRHPKIQPGHLRRQAVVYIRQSSAHQVRGNRESAARQYALKERAKALGWPAKAVQAIDEDQGRSGTSVVHREGFKKLLAEIGAGQVGIVLALEASRLARSSADWHRLVEICVVTQTLLADEAAVYDPRDPNDRLLLGVKGTISDADIFPLRNRLHEGRWNKARGGELSRALPVGYVRSESGSAIKDPDRQVQSRLAYIFRPFGRHKVAHQVLRQLVRERLQVPAKIWGGPRHGRVYWKDPDLSD